MSASPPRRPVVVFVPGFMQPATAWGAVAQLLPERYPSELLAHRAHDREGRVAEIAQAGAGNVVCGYSLGGRLSLLAALEEPERFAALVTVGAGAGIEDPATRAERARADLKLADWMEAQAIDNIVEVWERQPLFADQSDALVEEQRAGRLAQDPAALASLLRTAGQGSVEPFWQRLHTLRMPVLALAGAIDTRYSEAAERIARAVPFGRVRTIEHAGHAPHLQRPDRVARELVDFLDEHFADGLV